MNINEKLQLEKEIEGRPCTRDVAGVADGPVGGVLHGAVLFDVADGPVAAVLDRTVVLDVAHRPVGMVLDGPVALDVADRPVRTVHDLLCVELRTGQQQRRQQQNETHLFHSSQR